MGSFIVAFDVADDKLKKMDHAGVLTEIGGSIAPAYGHFYAIGDSFFPGYSSSSNFVAQNAVGMSLDNFTSSGAAITVTEAGTYQVNYSMGVPSGDPINTYAIFVNDTDFPSPLESIIYPGTTISSDDLVSPLPGTAIIDLPALGTIQLRSISANPSLVYSKTPEAISVSITVTKLDL